MRKILIMLLASGMFLAYNTRLYTPNELDYDILCNRNGKIIVEEVIGEVTSVTGDGKILNYADPYYYYINYENMENFEVGDIVKSYFIYNPFNNYEDDIAIRLDFISGKNSRTLENK